jgi:hypothetical protein
MIDEVKIILELLWSFKVLSYHIPGGIEGNPGKTLVRIVSVPAKIRTKHLPNMSL